MRTAVVGAALTLCFSFLSPPQAASAAGELQVSADGVTFSSVYPGALFAGAEPLIPTGSVERVFYLKNTSVESGYLRLTVGDVGATNSDFGDALTVKASTLQQTGQPVSILSANPCWVLLEGQVVAPGEVVQVRTFLTLADLLGQAGQGATATFSFNAALSSTAASLPPTSCGGSSLVIPVDPGAPSTPASEPPRSNTPGGTVVADDVPLSEAPLGEAANPDLPVLDLPERFGIDPNTWRLFEELFVFVLLGAFALGGLGFGIVAWRRRKADENVEEADVV